MRLLVAGSKASIIKGVRYMKELLCKIFGHSKRDALPNEIEKDMFGYAYVWQPKYCRRCGKRLVR